MIVLVTGASGFLGSHVARAASQRGHTVHCLVRASSDRSLLHDVTATMAIGDLTDPASLAAAVAGTDAVVHCAGTTSEMAANAELSQRTNVAGTAALLDACRVAGVGRFVFISSLSANERNTGVYGQTKLAAERLVAAAGVPFTVLRPSTVYGAGGRGLFAKIGEHVARLPVIPLVGNGRQRFSPVYVGDIAAAVFQCLETPKTVGQTYDLGGSDGVSFAEFIDGVGELLGKKRRKIGIPIPVCFALARILALVTPNPPLTAENIIGITQMSECDISRAQADFGYRPATFAEGIALMRKERARIAPLLAPAPGAHR